MLLDIGIFTFSYVCIIIIIIVRYINSMYLCKINYFLRYIVIFSPSLWIVCLRSIESYCTNNMKGVFCDWILWIPTRHYVNKIKNHTHLAKRAFTGRRSDKGQHEPFNSIEAVNCRVRAYVRACVRACVSACPPAGGVRWSSGKQNLTFVFWFE